MAFAVASVRAGGPIEIDDVANVATSFPGVPATARSVGLAVELGPPHLERLALELPPPRAGGRIVGEGVAAVPALVKALREEAKVI